MERAKNCSRLQPDGALLSSLTAVAGVFASPRFGCATFGLPFPFGAAAFAFCVALDAGRFVPAAAAGAGGSGSSAAVGSGIVSASVGVAGTMTPNLAKSPAGSVLVGAIQGYRSEGLCGATLIEKMLHLGTTCTHPHYVQASMHSSTEQHQRACISIDTSIVRTFVLALPGMVLQGPDNQCAGCASDSMQHVPLHCAVNRIIADH